jgi:hypothetical protein
MAEYKNIWYTDGSQPLSAADVSYNQAVSTGDALEEVKFNSPIICVSDATMNALFPTPVQYDRVFRTDLGMEMMYFDVYNSSTNINGRNIAGWYPISDGLVSIYDATAVSDGTSTTISPTGKVSFVNALNINFPNVFSSQFRNYKMITNINNSAAGGTVAGRYIASGSILNGSNYFRTNMVSETTTVAPPISAQSLTTSFVLQGSASFRNCYSETTLFAPYIGNYTSTITQSATANFSTTSRVQISSSFYNSASQVMNGININCGATMSGSIQIFGYN